ncbi:MAG: SDR family oxidoreductase [Alphaproteobacteria bacterium]|jgi:NAD(P)-dependent dehydrogenase (short-subunit alcohol dehydrogenase family)|nr:SDR family oxidoreductase [Alphaproteobacteria bacterium]
MKTVLITGANRGLGLEFARQYGAAGYRVIAACRKPENAVALREIPGVQIHQLDVDDLASVHALRRALSERAIDVLINNAGVFGNLGADGNVDYDLWLGLYNTNALGPLRVVRALLPLVLAGEDKTLVFITSTVASITNASSSNHGYRMSKVALNMLVKCLSLDLVGRGVTTLLFCPGHVQTDMGGPNAKVAPVDSVSGIIRQIDASTIVDTGRFRDYQGEDRPW